MSVEKTEIRAILHYLWKKGHEYKGDIKKELPMNVSHKICSDVSRKFTLALKTNYGQGDFLM